MLVCNPDPTAYPAAATREDARHRGIGRVIAVRGLGIAGAWLVVLAVACVVGYFIVGPSGEGASKSFDRSIARFVSQHEPGDLGAVAEILPAVLLALLVVAVVALVVQNSRNRLRNAAPSLAAIGASGIGAYGLSSALKEIFTRPRPPRSLALIADHGFSFPSSHTTVGLAMLVALVMVVTRLVDQRARRIVIAVAAVLAVTIPTSRLLLGVHWSTDVMIGGFVGATWGLTAYRFCIRPLPTDRPRRSPAARFTMLGSTVAVLLLSAPIAWSYAGALRYPGTADVGTRTTDWLRREGAGGIVNWIENNRFARPPIGALNLADANHPYSRGLRARTDRGGPAAVVVPDSFVGMGTRLGDPTAKLFDGHWVPVRNPRSATPALFTADWRPDPSLPNVSVAGVWMDATQVQSRLVAGTREPGGSGWSWSARIPPTQRTRVLAAFNGGFRLKEANGGFMADGRVGVPLRLGAASLVIHRDGSTDVESWSGTLAHDGTVVSVRQNLRLIVDHGAPVVGLRVNANGAWGSTRNQLQYTWRSALGVDARGNLVYVAGGGLDLQTLATALVQAGAVRGMELDIHHSVVTFNLYEPVPGHPDEVSSRKLLPDMGKPATRYLEPDQRDFVAILARTP